MLFSRITRKGLHVSRKDRLEHLEAYKEFMESEHYELLGFLYGNLNIVDSKTSALLRFNGAIVAITSLLLGLDDSLIWPGIFVIILLIGGGSSLISLYSLRLHWVSTDDLKNPEGLCEALLQIRDNRTENYRRAWLLSFISVTLFCLAVLINYLVLGLSGFIS